MRRDILSVTVEPLNPAVVRGQRLVACELAYAAANNGEEAPLRWFAISMLGLPSTWACMVAMAIWKTDAAGALGWREAENPFGYLRVAARRTALRWNPELVFGCETDRVLRPMERAVSTLRLRLPEDSEWSGDTLGYLAYNAYPEHPGDTDTSLHFGFYIVPELCLDPPRDGLRYDWDKIGERAGFDIDEIALLKARFRRVTRSAAGRFLGWPDHKVQAIWRRVNRRLDDDQVIERLELVLTGKITEVPEIFSACGVPVAEMAVRS